LSHPYFAGCTLPTTLQTKTKVTAEPADAPGANQSKNQFFNANNDFNKPSSNKAKLASRQGVLSRKSSVNKNSFYKHKAIPKLPEYLPNKPNIVGSRGSNQAYGGSEISLPTIGSSGG
jgi:hypothetical protein